LIDFPSYKTKALFFERYLHSEAKAKAGIRNIPININNIFFIILIFSNIFE